LKKSVRFITPLKKIFDMFKLRILDFDGTLTNVDEEAVGFVVEYQTRLANFLDEPVERHPERYGWKNEGRIVAPAFADRLIHSRVVAGVILDRKELYIEDHERNPLLENFYYSSYPKCTTVFKPGAKEFVGHLLSDRIPTVIVTNSSTSKVEEKLKVLGYTRNDIFVFGDTQKNVVDPTWKEVQEFRTFPGFGRPSFLQRRRYAQRLVEIMEASGVEDPLEVVVLGDIFELDLLYPLELGMRGVLTPRPSTTDAEIQAVLSYDNGKIARGFPQALDYLCN
jgi:FMN phosphatase YigB (HAD superfamily)